MRWLDGITDSMNMNFSKLGDSEGQGSLECCSLRGCRVRHDLEAEQQQQSKDTEGHCIMEKDLPSILNY